MEESRTTTEEQVKMLLNTAVRLNFITIFQIGYSGGGGGGSDSSNSGDGGSDGSDGERGRFGEGGDGSGLSLDSVPLSNFALRYNRANKAWFCRALAF